MTLENLAPAFNGRKVLVTGHTGFKGSWLSIWLDWLGANVTGYSLSPATTPNNFELSQLEKRISSYIGDIRDFSTLLKVFQKEQPEIVFHLAAQPLVRLSYKEPSMTYETNLMGTVNLLEAVRLTNSVKVVVVITSDKCYENKEWVWGYRETDELGGYDPYSSSKACVEIITTSYRRSYFNSSERKIYLATARAGNVIGGGDWSEDRIVPDLIKAIDRNEILELRNPKAVRPWQHVLEPLAGYLKLAALLSTEQETYEGAWNFGPVSGEVISVEDLIQHARFCWENAINYRINSTSDFLHETHYLQLDSSKAFRMLNWKAIMNPYQAVELTMDWYKAYYQSGTAAYELCLEQIKHYTALVQAQNY